MEGWVFFVCVFGLLYILGTYCKYKGRWDVCNFRNNVTVVSFNPDSIEIQQLDGFDLKCKDMLFEVPFESQPISELDPGMEVTN